MISGIHPADVFLGLDWIVGAPGRQGQGGTLEEDPQPEEFRKENDQGSMLLNIFVVEESFFCRELFD